MNYSTDDSQCPAGPFQQAKVHIILKALEQAEGNITQAARSLGLQRTYLHRIMRRLGLSSIE